MIGGVDLFFEVSDIGVDLLQFVGIFVCLAFEILHGRSLNEDIFGQLGFSRAEPGVFTICQRCLAEALMFDGVIFFVGQDAPEFVGF